jgi:glycyl-tRNA synthetase beta chain
VSETTVELLIEIGCEEIPARMLPGAARDLSRVVAGLLDQGGLGHGEPAAYWTPRRLAVHVPGTRARTEAAEETVIGPPANVAWDEQDRPTRAAEGFARKQGVAAEALTRVQTERGVYAGVVIEREPVDVGEVLASEFERAVSRISFPKTMSWGEGRHTFVRPVHWLVALADDRVLPLTLFGVRAGRLSRGHRVLAPEPIEIGRAAGWADALQAGHVQVDPHARRAALRRALAERARELGGDLVEDEELLAEVADMVEVPAALGGAFDRRFVDELPPEVLGTCLKHHQKAFSIRSDEGREPAFAVAVNMPDDPEGHIRRGHEWVVSGRLEDALFFWKEDLRRPLEERGAELEGVVFHDRLGTYADKTRRVVGLCGWIEERAELDGREVAALVRAAELARCDLVTGSVGEFPELQGVLGGLLAAEEGEPAAVVEAISGLYRPAGAEDSLPDGRVARLLGLADRLDTVVGGFAAGLIPSGSKDPFALRRAGTGLIRLAAAVEGLDLREAVDEAVAALGRTAGTEVVDRAREARGPILDFLLDRFATLAEREGARYDEINAVRAVADRRFDPADLFRRVKALAAFRESDDFLALAVASKRVRNILAQAVERGDAVEPGQHDAQLGEPEALALRDEVARVEGELADLGDPPDYRAALARLAATRRVVDRFFDEVLVMDPDAGRRAARLGLLARLNQLAQDVVDLSQIVVEGA